MIPTPPTSAPRSPLGPERRAGSLQDDRRWPVLERLHFVDEDTGVIEVKMHLTDPDTIVFATYERRRDMFDTNDPP